MKTNELVEELIAEGFTFTEDPREAIYILDNGALLSGDFDCGTRGTDHRGISFLIEGITPYENPGEFWDAVFNRLRVVMLIPETRFALYSKAQNITEAQKNVLRELNYTAEIN